MSNEGAKAPGTLYNAWMARGFDSKFVEAQQEEATRDKKIKPAMTPEQREIETRREALELARVRSRADLSRATAAAHRQMLEAAIAALDQQLALLAQQLALLVRS